MNQSLVSNQDLCAGAVGLPARVASAFASSLQAPVVAPFIPRRSPAVVCSLLLFSPGAREGGAFAFSFTEVFVLGAVVGILAMAVLFALFCEPWMRWLSLAERADRPLADELQPPHAVGDIRPELPDTRRVRKP